MKTRGGWETTTGMVLVPRRYPEWVRVVEVRADEGIVTLETLNHSKSWTASISHLSDRFRPEGA